MIPTNSRCLSCLLLFLPFLLVDSSNMGYTYDNIAKCESNSWGVSLDNFDVECEDTCASGEEATFSGQVTVDSDIPEAFQATFQLCKVWGMACISITHQEFNFCEDLGVEGAVEAGEDEGEGGEGGDEAAAGGGECPAAGTYSAVRTITVPSFSGESWLMDDIGFNVYLTLKDEDGDSMRCHAQFVTGSSNNTAYVSDATAGFAVLAMAGLTALGVVKKRKTRRLTQRIDLTSAENNNDEICTGFEMMPDGSVRC